MQVEQEHFTVIALEFSHVIRGIHWVTVRSLSICNINHNRRKAVGVLRKPIFDNALCLAESLTHGGASVGNRLEPNGKADGLVHEAARSIRYLFVSLVNPGWRIAYFANRHQ